MVDIIQNTFSKGEISALLRRRFDLKFYYNACLALRNMVVLPQGGATRPPGTYFCVETKDSSKHSRIIGFTFSQTQAYALEFGDHYLRFCKDGAQITSADGTVSAYSASTVYLDGHFCTSGGVTYRCIVSRSVGSSPPSANWVASTICELSTPYGEEEIFSLRADTQSCDVLYLFHPNHPTMKLQRYSHIDWRLQEVGWDLTAFLSMNAKDVTISGSAITGTGITLLSAIMITESENMIANFDMTGTTDWDSVGTPETSAHGTGHYHSAWYGWEINDSTASQGGAEQDLTFEVGKWYQLTYWRYLESGSGSVSVKVYDNDGTTELFTATHSTTGSWLKNTGQFLCNQTGTSAKISFRNNSASVAAHFWFDDVSIIEIPSPTDADIFNADHVGSYWQIAHAKDILVVDHDSSGSHSFSIAGQWTTPFECYGEWEFVTHGTWRGTVLVQRSRDGGNTWATYSSYTSQEDRNALTTGKETERDILFRFGVETTFSSGNAHCEFTVLEHTHYGLVQIKTFVNAHQVTADVIKDLYSTDPTDMWYEGAWSAYQGYPTCGCFHEERLYLAGTQLHPLSFWASGQGDYEDMEQSDELDSGIFFTLSANRLDNIFWMLSLADVLIAGTYNGAWKIEGLDKDKAIAFNNILARKQTTDVCVGELPPQQINGAILFISKSGLMDIVYSFTENSFISTNLSIFSDHLKNYQAVDMAYQCAPHSILWMVRSDGALIGVTYNPGQELLGWHSHETDGLYESVCSIPSGTEDQLWFIVNRTINGTTKRYIEWTKPYVFADKKDAFFVHSGLTYDGGAAQAIHSVSKASPCVVGVTGHTFVTGEFGKFQDVGGTTQLNDKVFYVVVDDANHIHLHDIDNVGNIDSTAFTTYTSGGTITKVAKTLAGLGHLEAKTVDIFADGNVGIPKTVASGSITLENFVNYAHVGLNYESVLIPTKVEIPMQVGSGIAQMSAKIKRVKKIIVSFFESLGCKYGDTEDEFTTLPFRVPADEMGESPDFFTGDKEVHFPGTYDREGQIVIKQDQPLPMTITAITSKVDVL